MSTDAPEILITMGVMRPMAGPFWRRSCTLAPWPSQTLSKVEEAKPAGFYEAARKRFSSRPRFAADNSGRRSVITFFITSYPFPGSSSSAGGQFQALIQPLSLFLG